MPIVLNSYCLISPNIKIIFFLKKKIKERGGESLDYNSKSS